VPVKVSELINRLRFLASANFGDMEVMVEQPHMDEMRVLTRAEVVELDGKATVVLTSE
jgi:hypothetical protein